ncbi:MAG: carbamoyltransferase HypF [Desulfobulbaceae bacterium]|uniref:Carbamoyltransferase n=1 Tax=Candidatus Desulfatifera sulfidica TaxID=2841691 RepID=A0A8J6TA02_9BACT|nr:carbamoyltransferase HypF [Candidatus Desulfatifera sulfidica]
MQTEGLAITVQGTVQGVGFRPFVYRLARRLGIFGTISNTGEGVLIQAEAPQERLEAFVSALTREAPPLSRIVSLQETPLLVSQGRHDFSILISTEAGSTQALIPPDAALCPDCSRELFDPADRRYGYPFINCTNCGPRFSIVETIPYDRPGTSMRSFPLCNDCHAEYDDPFDRRFHAQPNACPACGPSLSWYDFSGSLAVTSGVLATAAAALAAGWIVALRGLGGFHLVVDAGSEEAVARLRRRKKRPSKPLAVMAVDLDRLRAVCELDSMSEALLLGPQRPIVLSLRKSGRMLAAGLAPGIDELGVMLPYTPLHELLFRTPGCPKILVMTSGNRSGEPICTSNDEAREQLHGIADAFLFHNREIVNRIDDSVVRVMAGRPHLIRRARGYVPEPVTLPWDLPPLLACGGGLKSTFCLATGQTAQVSQHIGDMSSLEVMEFYQESMAHQQRLLRIEPELAICDLHPDYLSTRIAQESGLPLVQVQHHHAHVVAVMAEHGLDTQVVGVALDGTGYGPDGTIWGGEILLAEPADYQRLASFDLLSLPGGDAAVTAPWRMGLSALIHTFGAGQLDAALVPALQRIDVVQRQVVEAMIMQGLNAPKTSSCGRLFDAVAALLGLCLTADYEGQAAMELEALAQRARPEDQLNGQLGLPVVLRQDSDCLRIAHAGMIQMLSEQIKGGTSPELLSLAFHQWLIASVARAVIEVASRAQTRIVVLAGGCLQNRFLLEGLTTALEQENFQVYTGQRIPVNDGGISLGQAVIGGLRHVSGRTHAGS